MGVQRKAGERVGGDDVDTWRVRERKRKTGRDNSSLGNP